MRQSRATELSTGLFVLLGFAALFFLTTQVTNRGIRFGDEGYRVSAQFTNIGGLKVGAPVAMAGVRIGRVENIDFDKQTFMAQVSMRIDAKYDTVPEDSFANINTSGLLGGQYIGIEPGPSETYLKDGDQMTNTQPAIVLESLISKFLFSMGGKDKDAEGAASDESPPEPAK
jgi:phospholipid/cholesterol/gamma-HCH transport system substrate-binding protein